MHYYNSMKELIGNTPLGYPKPCEPICKTRIMESVGEC